MRRLLPVLSLLPCAFALGCSTSNDPALGRAQASAVAEDPIEDYYVVLAGPAAIEVIPAGVSLASQQATRVTRARIAEIDAAQSALEPLVTKAGGQVVARFSRLANAVQVLARPSGLPAIARLPGVVRVEKVPLHTLSLGSALPVIGAPAVWAKSTPLQGDGITIGIVDSGIDYTHADFGGAGTAAAYAANDPDVIEPGSFPTARVIGGWDFVGNDYNPSAGNSTPKPDPDPLDCTKPESGHVSGGHGTHVSGIAAGNGVKSDGTAFTGPYEQTFVPSAFKVAPGVAPRAKLFALKIFGCDGSTTALAQALERAADPNQDGSFDDRLDVVNASLGSSYGLTSPTNAQVVANLVKAGTSLVVAAGNDGQSFYAVASPAVFPQALAVAASADNQFVALSVTSPAGIAGDYPAAEGGFTTRLADVGKISSQVVAANPMLGCSASNFGAEVAGKIALVDRGQCSFTKKFNNAIAAGAIAAVIVDDEDSALPFAMGGGDPGSVAIPGVMIRKQDGQLIKNALAQGPVSVTLDPAKLFSGAGSELLAGFSARGPSSVDERLKPEVAAPGFSIDSARVGSGSAPRRSQGTSMASPVVAGAAALVRQARPTLSPLEIKALLVNSAQPIASLSTAAYSTSSVGGGRLAVDHAVELLTTAAADLAVGDVGVSFGSLVVDEKTTQKRSFVVTNHDASAKSFDLSVLPTHSLPGVQVSVAPTQLEVPAGGSASAEITLDVDPVALGNPGPDPATETMQFEQPRHYLNEASGLVRLSAKTGPEALTIPFHGSVRAAAKRTAASSALCAGASSGPVALTLSGPSAHPDPVVTAFQLGAMDPERTESATDPDAALVDLVAVGVATDLATAPSFNDASVFFGVAIAGEWTTPARGPVSIVSIEIDADMNGSADYAIRTEALTGEGPYADVIAATTYDLSSGQPTSRRFINMASADTAATSPFHNSVIVLAANFPDIGVASDSPVFDYAAVTESPSFLAQGERTFWLTYDAGKPALDPALNGEDGRPLYVGNAPVLVQVDADARAADGPLELLLLHHTNVAGSRYEVIDLRAADPSKLNLALEATAPATLSSEKNGEILLTVKNSGDSPSGAAVLTGTVSGGTLLNASPSTGSCKAGSSLDCQLGVLAVGESATVTVSVRADDGGQSLQLSASVDSGLACESSLDDNTVSTSSAVTGSGDAELPELSAHGGCGCRASSPRSSTPAWLSGLALAFVVLTRRRGSRRAVQSCLTK